MAIHIIRTLMQLIRDGGSGLGRQACSCRAQEVTHRSTRALGGEISADGLGYFPPPGKPHLCSLASGAMGPGKTKT